MLTKRITVGALALTALLSIVGPGHAQQGWPLNQPTGSSSFPWNSPGYRGYSEPQGATPAIVISTPAGQPQKYELNVNALSMMKNTEDPNALTLVAHVPEKAQIWFDDNKTTSTGTTRTFNWPTLAPGYKYSYKVRVAWVEDGKQVSQTQTLAFKAGDVQCVYLVEAGSKLEGAKDSVQANLARLSADDRELADKQRFCAVQNGVRLGAMGTPAKVIVQGQPVFLCCEACRERAQSNPEQTLAKVNELKAKSGAGNHDHE